MRRFADRLAIVERLDQREQVEIGLDLVGDLVEDAGALLNRRATQASLALWAASSASSISAAVERGTWQSLLPVIGLGLSKYLPSTGAIHFPPIKLS